VLNSFLGESEVKMRSHIALVAAFALVIHSFGFCAGAPTHCTGSVCAAHQQDGSCPRHPHQSGQDSRHLCCLSPMCLNAVELTAGKDASMTDVSMLVAAGFSLLSIDLARSRARLAALSWVHAPPPPVPIFLSIRKLVI
jgi:hypothetical protein